MCVRNVFVLVLLCCVNSRAQWRPNPLNGFQVLPEHPGMRPEGMAHPFHPLGLPDSPGYQYMGPKRPPPPEYEHIPESSNWHPQHVPPPGFLDNSNHHDMHPHRPPPVILEFPYDQDWNQPTVPDITDQLAGDLKPPVSPPRMAYAGRPRNLTVLALPLKNSDHELKFNVSWLPALTGVASDYALEIWNVNDTKNIHCKAHCYEFAIPGNVTSLLIPKVASTVADTCALRPGCAYIVKLIPNPWDGTTSAKLLKNLTECVENVCSCTHSPLLPVPKVSTDIVFKGGNMAFNITWTLDPPSDPNGLLPANLRKLRYKVSLSEQKVLLTNPWYSFTETGHLLADGLVSEGDTTKSLLLSLSGNQTTIPTVKILARVSLEDERECIGPAGNAIAFDPDTFRETAHAKSKFSFGVYAILGALIGAWAMGAVFVLSARFVKRVLKSFRPAPVSAPLEPLSRRPAWFPLQLRT